MTPSGAASTSTATARSGREASGWAAPVLGALAALVAAATYSSFLLGPALHSRLAASSSFISELEAVGQPHRDFFRMADVLSGTLIVVVAVVLFREMTLVRFVEDQLVSTGCLLIALMGAASVIDGTTEMGCAPSLNAACHAKDSTVLGLLSQTFETHTLSGMAGFIGGAGGMTLLGAALRRSALRRSAVRRSALRRPATRPLSGGLDEQELSSARWGTASRNVAIVLAAVGLIDLVLLAVDRYFGLAERARALVVSVWLLGVATYLLHRLWLRRAGRSSSTTSGRGTTR